jgi:hypothetical protein
LRVSSDPQRRGVPRFRCAPPAHPSERPPGSFWIVARFHASVTSSAAELLRRGETRSHAFAREHSPVGVSVPRPTLRPARDRLSRGFPPPRSASLLVAERYLLAVGHPPAHRFSPAATNEGVDFEVFFPAEMLTFARCYPRARSLPSSGSPPLGSYPWTRLRLPGDPPVTLAPRSSQNEGRMRSPSAFLRPEEQLRRHRLTDPLEVWSLPSLARWRGSSRRPTVRKTEPPDADENSDPSRRCKVENRGEAARERVHDRVRRVIHSMWTSCVARSTIASDRDRPWRDRPRSNPQRDPTDQPALVKSGEGLALQLGSLTLCADPEGDLSHPCRHRR